MMADQQIIYDFSEMDRISNFWSRLQNRSQLIRAKTKRIVADLQTKIHKTVRIYPPPLPNQKYVRTYKLQNSWQMGEIEDAGTEIKATVFSDGSARGRYGEYAQYVMHEKYQAQIHRGRWQTTDTIAEKYAGQLTEELTTMVKNQLEGEA